MRGGVAEEVIGQYRTDAAKVCSTAGANPAPAPIIPEGWHIIENVVLRSTDRYWNLTFQEWRKTKLWGGKPNPPTVYIRKNK